MTIRFWKNYILPSVLIILYISLFLYSMNINISSLNTVNDYNSCMSRHRSYNLIDAALICKNIQEDAIIMMKQIH